MAQQGEETYDMECCSMGLCEPQFWGATVESSLSSHRYLNFIDLIPSVQFRMWFLLQKLRVVLGARQREYYRSMYYKYHKANELFAQTNVRHMCVCEEKPARPDHLVAHRHGLLLSLSISDNIF